MRGSMPMSSIPLRNTVLRSVPGLCALAVGALLLMPVHSAGAATRIVSNCKDSGAGSLRNAVSSALDGDTIDAGSLACSRILLTSGEIEVRQDDLELVGRGPYALTIDGNLEHRVFRHSGTGTLRLRRVSIANGAEPNADGGCIHSQGSVELKHARVHHCRTAREGGGIYAIDKVLLSHSSACTNIAEDPRGGFGGIGGAVRASDIVLDHSQVQDNRADQGGGIAGGSVTATYSTIRRNQAQVAGGILAGCLDCTFTLRKSTVSANRSATLAGGFDAGATDSTLIVDSTVSDNVADNFSAGMLSNEARIFNSTIAFNQETGQCSGAINARPQLRLVSSIVSANTCSLGNDKDIGVFDADEIQGGNNIIGTSDVPVPPDTILARPRLGPLTDNGGPTLTRMPHADSPALDRGINPLDCLYDQRGPGFPRVKGVSTDIGAVER